MVKFYLRWHFNPTALPENPEERGKLLVSMLEAVKADLNSGVLTDWGVCSDPKGCSDSSEGYMLAETDENTLRTTIRKWSPYIIFDTSPVMTVDQTIASMKQAGAAKK
jgi:hypothetical protein